MAKHSQRPAVGSVCKMRHDAPFIPYSGDAPYLFASYAHKDAVRVFELLKPLHEAHYRIWYDEGIEAGAEWPETVASRLKAADRVLVFLSKNAADSQNCRREIHYAVAEKKKLTVVLLDECDLPEGLSMQLSVAETVRYEGAEKTVPELKLLLEKDLIGDGVTGYGSAFKKEKRRFNPWILVTVLLALLLLGGAAFFFLSMSGRISGTGISRETSAAGEEGGTVTVTRFSDDLSMQILLKSLNGDALFLCGNAIVSDARGIERKNGVWTVLGKEEPRGSVSDRSLTAFQGLKLTQLMLANERVTDITALSGMTELTYLDLSDDPLLDLSPLKNLTALETLVLFGVPEDLDLSVLAEMPALKQVYLSPAMAGQLDVLTDAGLEVLFRK